MATILGDDARRRRSETTLGDDRLADRLRTVLRAPLRRIFARGGCE
jgi:hypothetical protein